MKDTILQPFLHNFTKDKFAKSLQTFCCNDTNPEFDEWRKLNMGLVLNSQVVAIPDLTIVNFKDNPLLGLKMWEDCRPRRTRWIRNIIAHTTKGLIPLVKKGFGPDTNVEEKVAKWWSTSSSKAGAHATVDWDGSIGIHCDLITIAAYHAGVGNEVSIGIEIFQGSDGTIYEGQLEVVVKLINKLTAILGIQRQMPDPYHHGLIKRCVSGGKDVVGIYGHRHNTNRRGPGDPGDPIFEMLRDYGYETFDFDKNEDKTVWKVRQADLGLNPDGVPGSITCDKLRDAGHQDGLWVPQVEAPLGS